MDKKLEKQILKKKNSIFFQKSQLIDLNKHEKFSEIILGKKCNSVKFVRHRVLL